MDKRKIFRKALPLLIVLGAVVIAVVLVKTRPAPKKEVHENPGALVEILGVKVADHKMTVSGTGTVQARRETTITPQVNGKVIDVSPNFIAGGFFRKGEFMFAIEPVDYELSLERAKAALAQAELDLAKEESNAKIAREEWDRLRTASGEEPNPLVVYGPQLKRARAGVASAKAALKQAEIDLERTRLYAPFNGRIRSESIDLGQYIRAGAAVGAIAGTDEAEIIVPVSFEQLRWIRVPRNGSNRRGSKATVKLVSGNETYIWNGTVIRSLGELDERTRMERIVVAVQDPYRLRAKRKNGEPDLAVGMFVEVDIHGETLSRVVLVPRTALRDNDTVWLADEENMLRIRPISIIRSEKENVIVESGLTEGERVVLTPLVGGAEGMKLRPLEKDDRT